MLLDAVYLPSCVKEPSRSSPVLRGGKNYVLGSLNPCACTRCCQSRNNETVTIPTPKYFYSTWLVPSGLWSSLGSYNTVSIFINRQLCCCSYKMHMTNAFELVICVLVHDSVAGCRFHALPVLTPSACAAGPSPTSAGDR